MSAETGGSSSKMGVIYRLGGVLVFYFIKLELTAKEMLCAVGTAVLRPGRTNRMWQDRALLSSGSHANALSQFATAVVILEPLPAPKDLVSYDL